MSAEQTPLEAAAIKFVAAHADRNRLRQMRANLVCPYKQNKGLAPCWTRVDGVQVRELCPVCVKYVEVNAAIRLAERAYGSKLNTLLWEGRVK